MPGAGERIVGAVLRWRWWLLGLIGLVTVLSLVGASRVGVDNAVEVWFVDDDPTLLAYQRFQQTFGNDEVAVIGLVDDDILSPEGLEQVRQASDAAAAVPGIASARSVMSASTVRAEGTAIQVGPVLDDAPVDPAGAAQVREELATDPLLARLAGDGVALVLAQMDAMDDIDARRDGVLVQLRQAVSGVSVHTAFGGIGVIYAALNQASTEGAVVFILASYLLITLLLWWLFGRVGPVALTLGVVGLGSTWVMGLYGWAGRDINMVTMVMPTLVLVIGVSDCVHMLEQIAATDPALPRWERVKQGVGFVFWPCLFNTLTTSVGFLALTTSSMPVVRDLGMYSAVGLLAAFVLALVLCAVLGLSGIFEVRRREDGRLQRVVDATAGLAIARPRAVLLGGALLGLLASLGITRITVDTYSIDYLRASHPVRQDSALLEQTYGAYTPLEFVVERADGVRDPATLQAIARWQDRVAQSLPCPDTPDGPLDAYAPCVGWSHSAADLVRRLDGVLRGQDVGVVPVDAASIDQLLFLYESDPDADLSQLISGDGRQARVTFGVPMDSAQGFGRTIQAIQSRAQLPDGVTVHAAGYLPLYVRMMDYIVGSQLTSFGLAFIVIFGLIGLLFRSVRYTVLAVPANLLPVLLTLGVMGLLGVRLDVATVTIAAIVLGLVVDDTVQFLYRYRYESSRHDTVSEAVRASVRRVGRPMAITTIVLGLGFLVLGLATVKSVAWFGVLLAVALFSALAADLLVVPALLVVLARR